MDGDRIECLKRELKRTYKRYIGERTDEKATLLDVAEFFNIPVDESRIEDYSIKKIDYDTPSIEISDEKNDITYTATYIGNALELLNWCGPKEFISVVSIRPIGKDRPLIEESLYYIIGDKTPLVTKMTFNDGEYELVFERVMPHSVGVFANDGIRMKIKYSQNVLYDGRNVKQRLFNKTYKNNYRNGKFDGVFEHTYTSEPHRFIEWDDSQDKYAYIRNNNVIYGINELKRAGICDYLYGVCFESTDAITSDCFPLDMHAKDYPLLSEDNINSAMVLRFGTRNNIHHSLQVYKSNDCISITFHSEKHHDEEDSHVEILANEEYGLPKLSDGTISSEEIQNIVSSLQARLGDNEALNAISSELSAFGTKIDIRKGIVQEELDPLSPKLFIDKPFEEIYTLVSEHKDDYFKLIKEQFGMAANINGNSEKGQPKVLKSNSSQSSEN